MLKKYVTELYARTNIIIITYTITIVIITQYTTELLIFLLNPVKEINNDWYNFMLYDLIMNTFDILDTETLQNNNYECTIEYLPSCEMVIKSTILNTTINILSIHISILIIAAIIVYHTILYTIPSLFEFEKKIYIYECVYAISILVASIMLTHNLWTHLFLNIAFHNYQEFNYYEFDVEFDIHFYVMKYIYTTYITFILILCIHHNIIRTKKIIIIIIIFLYIIQILNILEVVYHMSILFTYYEIRTYIHIINEKQNNLYRLVL